MAITFYKLWDKLNREGLKKKDLREQLKLSPTTVAKMTKNEVITTETLSRICDYLNCNIEDICEYQPDKEVKRSED